MKVWIVEIGEPLPVEHDVRLLRYGLLTKELAKYGHEVVWWTSSFSMLQKGMSAMMIGITLSTE
jgi:hypothetical protein